MAKKMKTAGAKGSPAVAASKPEPKAKGRTPLVAITPDAEPKAETKAKAKANVAGKYLSRDQFDIDGTGLRRLRVAEYQDYTFAVNDREGQRLTDEELCVNWQSQFPNAVAFRPFHVRGARRDFNAGRHSKYSTALGPRTGADLSTAYVIVDGKRIRADQAPKPPKPVKAETPAPAPAAPKVKVAVRKHQHAA